MGFPPIPPVGFLQWVREGLLFLVGLVGRGVLEAFAREEWDPERV